MLISVLLIPLLVAMLLAVNMGASGTAPAFSTAFGSRLIKKTYIPLLFGLFVFLGAVLAGKNVALTMGNGIIAAPSMTLTLTTVILISVTISIFVANMLGVPQSTSQSTVFALVGAALYFNILEKKKLLYEIIPTWFILPVIAFVVTYIIANICTKKLTEAQANSLNQLARHPGLRIIVILASCYVAFAIGSNNVANVSGPLSSMIVNEMRLQPGPDNFLMISMLTTLIIAPTFGIGSSILGHRLVKNTGRKIVDIGPLAATLISIITASLLLMASVIKGIPTSLVQLNTGAIIALGISKIGWRNMLKIKMVRMFWLVWIIAPIISLILSFLMAYLADKIGIL
ncbi:MAG: inorganic phosphate transporter [Hymenobacteraceae bacterium]|nr:inorganic phosphate transporter [Hymenobacteraceae bacterium]MDX5395811.1 inorganic phosphate transporter [Hymenobacteraceae bacterium]MDX5442950.1 inorganic phosphate transporter [Hymenobacteraceae bacterium]MDX5511866.1 inorganic phosphate transporter [Hymenobacteraceae bacterium]